MKKIIICLLLLLSFNKVYASCDLSKLDEYNTLSKNIDYETNYNNKVWTVKLFNVYEGIYAKYDGKYYYSKNNQIIINDVPEGKSLSIMVYAPLDDCDSYLKTIYVTTKYYNNVYNDARCVKYREILTICKTEFLTYKSTNDLLVNAINNYENSYKEEKKIEENNNEKVFLDYIIDFGKEWGISLLLFILSSIVSIYLYKIKLRKLEHRI